MKFMRNGLYISECGSNYFKYWYHNDKFHRLNGPAISNNTGSFGHWYINGELHRLDGPALSDKDAKDYKYTYWYYKGKFFDCDNQKDFERLIKLLVFK